MGCDEMQIWLKKAVFMVAVVLVAGCAGAPKKDLSKLQEAGVRSILIVPVLNQTSTVGASEAMIATLPIPVAESGYYVYPVNLVKRVLEDDGLSDAMLLQQADPSKLAGLFGADAVLFVTIEKWTSKYMLITTEVEVKLRYVLRDGRTGEVLWEETREKSYVPPNNSSGIGALIEGVMTAAVTKARPNYVPLAKMINEEAFTYPGPGLIPGPYKKSRAR
jgi:hypothetical protein